MKRVALVALLLVLAAPHAHAQPSPPYEILRDDVDMEAAPDGRNWTLEEIHSRPLTSAGVEVTRQIVLYYVNGSESLGVKAYTLKKDGTRIDIPQGDMLQGHEDSSNPGYDDTRTISVFFPKLEIGDQTVVVTTRVQNKPWFANVFAYTQSWPRGVAVREATFVFTSEDKDNFFHITTSGVDKDVVTPGDITTRHVWHFHNDNPVLDEPEAVSEIDDAPHVTITSLSGYSRVADIYAGLFKDKTEVTPEIAKLANDLTAGISDRRAQARALYDWISAHIRYVAIVLGAGGFEPHRAQDVLANGYGDCKDHVMLLQALLSAKDIKSSAVLIRAGMSRYRLPAAASPFLFDHLITYVPEFQLYLDSTAQYAAFGVLPSGDAGKNVVIVSTGHTATTPPVKAAQSTIAVASNVTLNPDGSADGETKVAATGDQATSMRALMAVLPPDDDDAFFRGLLGPGSSGKFLRGEPEKLGDSYEYSAKYHIAHLANFPGPGALPVTLSYKPFSFSQQLGLQLPATRQLDYACPSGTFSDDTNVTLPPGVSIVALPANKTLAADGAMLETGYTQPAPNIVRQHMMMKLDRPGPVCRAADYAKLRPQLSDMIGNLMSQIIYK